MASRKGSLLEKQAESIFPSAGFDTETNKYHSGYEIDVYAELGDLSLIAECKQYENSSLSVRNLIHQWKGKNESIEADVLVLVIYGQEIKDEEKELAEQNNIDIWDEKTIEKLLNMEDEEVKNYVFKNLPIKEDRGLGDSYRTEIRKLVWKPYLSYDDIDEDESYDQLLNWTKKRIRRQLFQEGTTKTERRKHIEFFEQVYKEGKVRANIPVNSQHERFKRLSSKLQEKDSSFVDEREEQYKNYLRSLHETYEDSKGYYHDSKGREKLGRLIESRLKDIVTDNSAASFSDLKKRNQIVRAEPVNSGIKLNFELEDESDLETIRWILTKEGRHKRIEEENPNGNIVRTRNEVWFTYKEVEDAKNAVLRVFDEYYDYDMENMRLIDHTLAEYFGGKSLLEKFVDWLKNL